MGKVLSDRLKGTKLGLERGGVGCLHPQDIAVQLHATSQEQGGSLFRLPITQAAPNIASCPVHSSQTSGKPEQKAKVKQETQQGEHEGDLTPIYITPQNRSCFLRKPEDNSLVLLALSLPLS